jgi:membrane protease YdiL (CAAX protease family)
VLQDDVACRLRGFGPLGILAILVVFAGNLVIVPLSAILALLWAKRSGTPWSELGFVRPDSWARTVIVGIAFGIALKFLMKVIVMPLLGADPINQAYYYLVGNPSALPGMFYAIIIGAGFGEETLFRGFLFERMGKLLGPSPNAKTLIVLLGAGLFGLAHYMEQGVPGVQQALIVGLVFGATFAVTGRIVMLMIAHAAFDLTALAIIYWNLEYAVAQLIFK